MRKYDQTRNLEVTSDVIEFLQKIYCSVAETLPDVRDDTLSDDESSLPKIDVRVQQPDSEPYADFSLALRADIRCPPSAKQSKPKTRPRKMRKSIPIRPGRGSAENEERFLPPGTMKEYHTQYVRQSGLAKPASFPCFWRVPWLSLAHKFDAFPESVFAVAFCGGPFKLLIGRVCGMEPRSTLRRCGLPTSPS